MSWIHAASGNVFEVPESYVAELVGQGHLAFETEAAARKAKTPARKSEPVAEVQPEPEN